MARPLRYDPPGSIHHITSRGVERRDIVVDDRDRRTFVELLARVVLERQWILHSWVLMTNHLHLVVETPISNLSEGMRDLLGDFASWFNRVHRRVGHLFQHRFDSKAVERETHLLELIRYLPLNPVRCGLVRDPAEWEWGSYRATAGLALEPSWLETGWTLDQFDRATGSGRFGGESEPPDHSPAYHLSMRAATAFLLVLTFGFASDLKGTICVEMPPSKVRLIRGIVVTAIEDRLCPFPGVEVELQRGKAQMRTTSDDDGYFAFAGRPNGPYTVSARWHEGLTEADVHRVHVDRSQPVDRVLLLGIELSAFACGNWIDVVTAEEAAAIQKDPACK